MSQSPSQPARPTSSVPTKLDIRSLATPKPPRRFLSQAPAPLTPSLYRSLPSPPFTPIEPPAPPLPSLHTQPLHSTPLQIINSVIIEETEDIKERDVEDPSLPEQEDMEQGDDSSDESETSLPSPAYVPISKFVSITPRLHKENDCPPAGLKGVAENVCEKTKVESVFDISLDSLVSDYPECGIDGLSDSLDCGAGGQEEPPGGGLEGEVHVQFPPVISQKTSMTRFVTPTTNPRLIGPGQVENYHGHVPVDTIARSSREEGGRRTHLSFHQLPGTPWQTRASSFSPQNGNIEREASSSSNLAKATWSTSSDYEKVAYSSPRMDKAAFTIQPGSTAWSSSSQLGREASSSPRQTRTGWSSSTQMDRADSFRLQFKRAAYSNTSPARPAWSSSREMDMAAYSSSQLARQLNVTSDDSGMLQRGDRCRQVVEKEDNVLQYQERQTPSQALRTSPPQTPIYRPNLGHAASATNTRTAWTMDCAGRGRGDTPHSQSHTPVTVPGQTSTQVLPTPPSQTTPVLSQQRGQNTPVPHTTQNTLSNKVSRLGKARSLFSPSPSPHSSNVKSSQQKTSTSMERGVGMEQEEERILSICYAGGNLGAALFNTYTCKLELLRDIPDLSPSYEMLTSLVYQVEPDIILVSARQDQTLLECLTCLCGNPDSETSSSGTEDSRSADDGSGRCISLVMRPGMEFGLSSCTRRVRRMEVPGKPATCEQEQLVKLSAFVDFSCNSLVRAAGALLKYLDKNYRTGLDQETPMVLFINSLVLDKILTMDQSAFTALQVFSSSSQLSGSTAGSWNRRREGLSMLNILNRCGSVVGSRFMRRMLRCPSANLEVIIYRQQAIAFFTSSGNVEFVQALSASIKQIKNFHRLMSKLMGNTMSVSDWQALYRTLSGLVQLAQLGENCRLEVPILKDIMYKVTDSVYSLRSVVDQVIDFQASLATGNLSVKPGVDQELDEKRRLHNALPDLLNVVAQEESKNLPPYMKVCTVCYLPQVGYLIAIPYKKELEDQGVDFRKIPSFEFVFESNGAMHYRNRRTLALDQTMGDVVLDITRVEMGILSRLTEAVLRNRNSMEEAVSLCGQLDCLLALAMVSKENNWTRPIMVDTGDLVIKEGRHPLQQLSVTHFIPNSSWLGEEGGRVHLLTGPNSSGKSVYMKQVGLIVYLAHLGCWVPAQEARIPITDRILTRIQTVESISLGMSSFLCDINQLSTALSTSSTRSLLLVDEFGKGTAPSDGAALLAATVLELLSLGLTSPLCILSSHFHLVPPLLGSHSALRYFQLETQATTSGLVYLYKLVVGVSGSSQARTVALKAGIQEDLVDRADQVLQGLVKGQPANLQDSLLSLESIHQLVSCFLDVDLEKEEEVDIYIGRLGEVVT